jgi:hypothetical protein
MDTKTYVIKKTAGFTREQNITILKFLIQINAKVCESSDGCRVNLDTLDDKQITGLKSKIDVLDIPIDPKYQI